MQNWRVVISNFSCNVNLDGEAFVVDEDVKIDLDDHNKCDNCDKLRAADRWFPDDIKENEDINTRMQISDSVYGNIWSQIIDVMTKTHSKKHKTFNRSSLSSWHWTF